MNTRWWTPALSLAERCELQDQAWEPDTAARWREHWQQSLGFGGSAEVVHERFARIASTEVINQALGLRTDQVEMDTPDWAERLNRLYVEQPWPDKRQIIKVLTDVPGVPEEAIYGGLGGLVVAAPLLIDARNQLDDGIAKIMSRYGQDVTIAEQWRRMLWPTVVQRVAGVFARTLVLEVNADRVSGVLKGDTPEARHRSFVESLLTGPRVLAILKEYPVMFRQGLMIVEQTVNVLLELVERLHHDRPVLESTFGLGQDVAVAGFSLDAGDTHRNGRSVALIRFADTAGTVIVYKPRPMAVDAAFEGMVSWFSDRLVQSGHPDLAVPGTINQGEYGWSEFIKPAPCPDDAHVQRFYRRQGLILSLLHVLGGSDFHFENCIAAGEYPMLIDLETLFHQMHETQRPEAMPDGDFDIFLELNRSVMQIGLLPIPLWGTEDRPGVDLSGLGGEPGQVIPQPHGVLKDGGTDQARIERVDSHDLPGQLNRPTLNSDPVRTEDYIEDVVAGFNAGYEVLSQNTEDVLRCLEAFKDAELRYIVRHTATYARLLLESSHPDLNRDGLARDCFLDGLWAAARNDDTLVPVVEAERADLETGNIPLFTFRPESPALRSFNGHTLEAYFPSSGLQALSTRAKNLTVDDRDFQSWVIRASIASRGKSVKVPIPPTVSGPSASGGIEDRAIRAAEQYAAELTRTARGVDDPSWPTLAPAPGGQWTIGPMDDSLYRGKAGVAVFLCAAGQLLRREDFTDLSRRLAGAAFDRLETALETPAGPRQELHHRLGAFDGIGGILYTASLTEASGTKRLREAAIKALHDQSADRGIPTDVIAGLAGLVLVAESQNLLTAQELAPFRDRLRELLASNHEDNPLLGLGAGYGHGISGLRAAISDHPAAILADAPAPLTDIGSPSEGGTVVQATSWCNGDLGLLAHYLRLYPAADEKARQIITEASSLLLGRLPAHADAYRDDTLCHGSAGALDLLIEAEAVGLIGAQGSQLRQSLVLDLLQRAERGTVRSLVPHAVQTPGLLDGLSGLYLTLLRAVDRTVAPSVLIQS